MEMDTFIKSHGPLGKIHVHFFGVDQKSRLKGTRSKGLPAEVPTALPPVWPALQGPLVRIWGPLVWRTALPACQGGGTVSRDRGGLAIAPSALAAVGSPGRICGDEQ